MLPTGYHWREEGGIWRLTGPTGKVAAQVQEAGGRWLVTVGMDGQFHRVQKGSCATLDRARWHVERWVEGRS